MQWQISRLQPLPGIKPPVIKPIARGGCVSLCYRILLNIRMDTHEENCDRLFSEWMIGPEYGRCTRINVYVYMFLKEMRCVMWVILCAVAMTSM
jgi:hypothetical protein